MVDLKQLLGCRVSDWDQLTGLVCDPEAVNSLENLKALVGANRKLAQVVYYLNEIQEQKFTAAENLAKIKEDDQDAKLNRQQLWAEIEKATAHQKILIYQSANDVMTSLNQTQKDRLAMAENALVARAQNSL